MARKKTKKIEPENNVVVNEFKALLVHPGWARLVSILDENIEVLEQQIISKTDADQLVLTEKACDELRFKVGYMKELQKIPEKMIEQKTFVPEPEDSADPY